MSFEPNWNKKPKRRTIADGIYQVFITLLASYVVLVLTAEVDHFIRIILALCLVCGVGLIFLSNFLQLNTVSGLILFIGWSLFTTYAISIPQCLEEQTTRSWENYLFTENMEKWSPELPEETKNKFLAGELMLAYDAGYYRKVPDELKNLDRRKVKLHPHFDMSEYETRKEIKEYNLEECKRRESPIEGLFSLF